jgi:hypothetical protein
MWRIGLECVNRGDKNVKAVGIVFSVTAALIGPLSLSAAPALKIEPLDSSIVGLTVTGPDDPEFQALAASLIPADKMAAATPYLPQAIIVTNNSGKALEALAYQYTVVAPSGRPIHNRTVLASDSFSQPVMAAGERRILSEGGLASLLAGKQSKKPAPAAAENLSVSIDLVVYADWLVAGPDQAQHLPRLLSTMRAQQYVCSQLGSGAATLTSLEKEAAAEVQPPPQGSTDWYTFDVQRMAARLFPWLRDGNTEQANRMCAPVLAASGIAASLHR